ncbi:hypothetical protein NDU88_007320 [Pleurodeles waltl]|uniref:Uncharacterized protein n=1 Tax=Pleurodeles waltl TaxID=8319 RepID=A0AAV7QRJ7_PLEWA|nr:hypothetical protein NDU88_007320 [Pleurodeles waltl]
MGRPEPTPSAMERMRPDVIWEMRVDCRGAALRAVVCRIQGDACEEINRGIRLLVFVAHAMARAYADYIATGI